MKSSTDRALSAATGRAVRQHLVGELEELEEHLDAEVVGLDLGLDALDRRAHSSSRPPPAHLHGQVLRSLPPGHLPQQTAREQLSVRE